MKQKRALVVDDEPSCLMSLREMLQADDFEVETAGDFDTAMAILRQRRFHIVITDNWLSRNHSSSGMEVLKYVKKNRPDTKVVVMTGFAHGDMGKEARELGADLMVEKPFEWDHFRKVIQRML